MDKASIGVIGCGNSSEAYLKAAKFPLLDIRGGGSADQDEATGAWQWTC